MGKKRHIWALLLLVASSAPLFGAAGRPKDGLLFFIVVLGFLGLILGILHLADFIKLRLRKFLDSLVEGLLP